MRMCVSLGAAVLFGLILPAATVAAPADDRKGAVDVRVDPRVELVSIVFRLAGSDEYNMKNSKSPYADDVEAHFGKFRDHPTVRLARDLRSTRGIGYDAVMSLAVHLGDDVANPAPRTPLDPRPPLLEGRWSPAAARDFIESLGAFVRDTDFAGFLDKNRDRYERSAAKLSAVVNRRDYVGWFNGFFGERPAARFTVIVGMLEGGGNYGVSMRHHDGREEITPVIGIYQWDVNGLPAIGDEVTSTIVHEFCHSYTNAIVDTHYAELQHAGDVLFERNAELMRRQAYSGGRTVLYETLVRGVVAHYMATQIGPAAGKRQTIFEMARGFRWTSGLVGLLAEYDGARDKYPRFEDFVPRVVAYLNETAEKYADLEAKFPRVVSMSPPNGAADVDAAATTQIVITFDRPMTDRSWSIVGGGPKYPKMGAPSYDAARRVLTLPVTLEPGKEYEFGLNGGQFFGFMAEDGMTLSPVKVRFSTKP